MNVTQENCLRAPVLQFVSTPSSRPLTLLPRFTCRAQPNPPLACSQLKETALSLRQSLAKAAASTGSNYDLSRSSHKWDIFGAEPDLSTLVRGPVAF